MHARRMVRALLPVLTRRVSPSPTETTVALNPLPGAAAVAPMAVMVPVTRARATNELVNRLTGIGLSPTGNYSVCNWAPGLKPVMQDTHDFKPCCIRKELYRERLIRVATSGCLSDKKCEVQAGRCPPDLGTLTPLPQPCMARLPPRH